MGSNTACCRDPDNFSIDGATVPLCINAYVEGAVGSVVFMFMVDVLLLVFVNVLLLIMFYYSMDFHGQSPMKTKLVFFSLVTFVVAKCL